jgi:hypothetical protein
MIDITMLFLNNIYKDREEIEVMAMRLIVYI